ncbi:hypothetical protein [Halodurantibacterium flavum]|uniref:Glycosyl transferase n=1 Tax=Halodurantibacterium flavum TaxID=1382802 RepID=A0ABW4S7G7_9RHOB
MPSERPGTPQLQYVFVIWGTKYPVTNINAMIEAIGRASPLPARFVCLSDRPRPDLHPLAELQELGPAFDRPEYKSRGTQAKLAVFEQGRLLPDVPAIYFDLDTMILGDPARLARLLDRRRGLHLIPATDGRFWGIGKWINRIVPNAIRFRGNGSIFVFRPEDWYHLPGRFLDLAERTPHPRPRHLWADDRFISWAAGPAIYPIPQNLAVKFVNEFTSRPAALAGIKGRLPFVRKRRAGLVAITFSGDAFNPEDLLSLPPGGRLRDRKGRVLVWNDHVMSGLIGPIRRYWTHLT